MKPSSTTPVTGIERAAKELMAQPLRRCGPREARARSQRTTAAHTWATKEVDSTTRRIHSTPSHGSNGSRMVRSQWA